MSDYRIDAAFGERVTPNRPYVGDREHSDADELNLSRAKPRPGDVDFCPWCGGEHDPGKMR